MVTPLMTHVDGLKDAVKDDADVFVFFFRCEGYHPTIQKRRAQYSSHEPKETQSGGTIITNPRAKERFCKRWHSRGQPGSAGVNRRRCADSQLLFATCRWSSSLDGSRRYLAQRTSRRWLRPTSQSAIAPPQDDAALRDECGPDRGV